MRSRLLLSLFIHGFPSTLFLFRTTFFLLEQTIFNVLQTFQTYWVDSSTQYIPVIKNSCYIDYLVFCHHSCTIVLYQLSSLTIIYFIIGVKSLSPTFLVAMSANCRPPSHQSILWILQFYPFLNKLFILAMCLVCLVSLPFLSIHIADLLLGGPLIKSWEINFLNTLIFCL